MNCIRLQWSKRFQGEDFVAKIRNFAWKTHASSVRGANEAFKKCLSIRVSRSVPGPQFITHAPGDSGSDGLNQVSASIETDLRRLPGILIFLKSDRIKKTDNRMFVVKGTFEQANLHFDRHTSPIITLGNELAKQVSENTSLKRFLRWDWRSSNQRIVSKPTASETGQ